MAPWMLSALRLLGIGVGGGLAAEAVTGLDVIPGIQAPSILGAVGGLFGGGRARRRRRKRALTASDREDLLFLSSMMSKAGVERVAAVMVAR